MKLILALGITVLAWSAGVVAAFAEEPVSVKYNEFSENTHISGPELKAKDLKGKIVLWEFWGIHCPPCRASMPHLQEIYNKYARRGKIIVVASHVQTLSPKVKEYINEQNFTFPVYQYATIGGVTIPGGIPYTVLIGADGKVITAGFPGKVFEALEKIVRKVPDKEPLFPNFKATRYKSVHASLISGGANLEAKVASLRVKQDDEAKELCRLFDAWATGEIRELKLLLKEKSFESVALYDSLKRSLPEAVKPFASKADAIRKTREFIALADLSKKTEALERRREKGRKVSAKSVEEIQKKLEPFSESDRTPVKEAANAILARLKTFNR